MNVYNPYEENESRREKKNHLGETSSMLKAMHTYNRIQLLFALYTYVCILFYSSVGDPL